MRSLLLLTVSLLFSATIAGCGTKGDLYLPSDKTEKPASAPQKDRLPTSASTGSAT